MLAFDSYSSNLVKRLVHLELVVSVDRLVSQVFGFAKVLGHSMVVSQVVVFIELHFMVVETIFQYLYHNQR